VELAYVYLAVYKEVGKKQTEESYRGGNDGYSAKLVLVMHHIFGKSSIGYILEQNILV